VKQELWFLLPGYTARDIVLTDPPHGERV